MTAEIVGPPVSAHLADSRDAQRIDFRYAPASSWTPICRPDDPAKSLVAEDGTLLYGFEQTHLASWRFRRTVEFRAQTAHAPTSVHQRTEDARTPIVVTTFTYPRCQLELRTAGHRSPDGHRYDVVVWTLRVAEDVDELLAGLHIDIYESGNVRHAAAGVTPSSRIYAMRPERVPEHPPFIDDVSDEEGIAPPSGSELVLVSADHRLSLAHATGFRPATGLQTTPVVVHDGTSLRGAIVLPLDGGTTEGVDLAWARRALDRERHYWRGLSTLDDRTFPMRVPDPDLHDMLVAAARNILQARDLAPDGRPVFQVGPTVYRGLWIVDGHFLLEAAQYLGLAADARHGTRALLARVRNDGSINAMADLPGLAEHPHTKETGIAVTTLVRQWELTGDDAWLRDLWPIVRGAADYIEGLRRRAYELPQDSPAHGLLPPAFSDGGIAGARPELTTALWTAVGLKYAAGAARRLAPGDQDHLRRMYDELADDMRRVIGTYGQRLRDGHHVTPMVLPGGGQHHTQPGVDDPAEPHRIRPESATWALAQAIWPGEVFAPDDDVVRDFLHLLDTLDDDEQAPRTSGWLPYRALWTYYASFAAHVWLYAGYPDKAVELLYGFCNHASPTRVWREEQPLAGTGHDQVWGDMPHNWASAELIRLVRHLIVFERGDVLEILPGVPARWIDCADGVRIDRTPTRFGEVSVHAYRKDPAQPGIVRIALTPHTAKGPRRGERPLLSGSLLNLPAAGQWQVYVNNTYTGTVDGPAQHPLGEEAPRG